MEVFVEHRVYKRDKKDIWHSGVVNIISKFQIPCSNGLGYKYFESIYTNHDRIHELVTEMFVELFPPGLLIINVRIFNN